jgi:hypothetical protein
VISAASRIEAQAFDHPEVLGALPEAAVEQWRAESALPVRQLSW